jgi:hypothetical protein
LLSGAAAGTSYDWYTLTNVGPAACSMIGYPGVAILNAHRRVVQHPAVWSTHPGTMPPERVRLVVLTTGRRAKFVIANTDVTPSPGCRAPYTGKTLQVYPPNQITAIREPYHGTFCDLVVGPVQPARPHRRTRRSRPRSSVRGGSPDVLGARQLGTGGSSIRSALGWLRRGRPKR